MIAHGFSRFSEETALHLLLLAIVNSAAMALVLRCFSAQRGNRYAILLGNYLACVAIALFSMGGLDSLRSAAPATRLCGLINGVLFVLNLVIMQSSIRVNGAALSSAFAKLGLLVTLTASVLFFHERPGVLQAVGIVLVLAAIMLISGRDEDAPERAPKLSLLLLTLLTGGCGDAMIKVYEQLGPAGESAVFFFFLFATSAVLTAALALFEFRRTGKKLLLTEMAAGIAVGIPNYFSSYLVLQVLRFLPAFVTYSVYSTGTILLVLVLSALLFREKPGKRQLFGIALILGALVLLNC